MSYDTIVLGRSGLLAYWRCDDAAGAGNNPLTDSSGNGRSTTSTAGFPSYQQPPCTTAVGGFSVQLPSSSTSFAISNPSWAQGGTTFSAEAWYKTSGSGIIIARDNTLYPTTGFSNRMFAFRLSSGALAVDFFNSSGDVAVVDMVTSNDGNWHYGVATYNNGAVKLYRDGSLVGSTSAGGGSLDSGSGSNITFGNRPSSAGNGSPVDNYVGYLDQLALYSVELTATDVSATWAAASSGGPLRIPQMFGNTMTAVHRAAMR